MRATLRKAAAALRAADVPFLLGGAAACWAHGGLRPEKDLDLMVRPDDAERALEALVGVGMEGEHPPEEWLLKARDGDVLVDLIFAPKGLQIDKKTIRGADEMSVAGVSMRVMSLEDVLTSKLLALDSEYLDYGAPLQMARSLRERIDWEELRRRTKESPYARTFFLLLEEVGVITKRNSAS
jgi:hypothetical protein